MRLATELENNFVESIVDGEGFRLTMFTQGCLHHCKGCHNPTTWDMKSGHEYSVEEIAVHFLKAYRKAKAFYSGLTISGGDPLFQKNELLEFLKILKKEEPDLNVWLYTGFEKEEFFKDFKEISSYINVVVTGKFIESKRDISCKFKGSTNQEIVYI